MAGDRVMKQVLVLHKRNLYKIQLTIKLKLYII